MPAANPTLERETTIATAWPSIASMGLGRVLGRWYNRGPRISVAGIPFRPGWLIAVISIPLALLLYLAKVVPRRLIVVGPSNPFCRRYRLTTERVLVEHPFDALSTRRHDQSVRGSVRLDQFDAIDVETRPGYEWFRAGDLVFRQDANEVLRLPAVPHPESFRHTCLSANRSHRGVQLARASRPATTASDER